MERSSKTTIVAKPTRNDSILSLDELTKRILDSLETHLRRRRVIDGGRINIILMNVWEEILQEEAFQFINSKNNKMQKLVNLMEECCEIVRKIQNGVYDNNNNN